MKRSIFLILSFCCLFSVFGKKNSPSPFNIKYTVESYGKDPGATPEQVQARLDALPTEVEMRYSSEVQKYIDNYIKHGRKQVVNLLLLSSYYFPIFEQALKEAGLPEELKYLPVIESGLRPEATSNRGAAGLWQFMAIAARGYDMKMTSAIDERRDPYLSSQRACRMLKDLYDKFGDWSLVIAAYNCGPGTVERILKRAGGDYSDHNFWTIRQYLPAQTRKYVPLFIAMNYVMNYYDEHNIPYVKIDYPYLTETIQFTEQENLRQIAAIYDVSLEELKVLNPQYKSDVIPASESRPCTVIVPVGGEREFCISISGIRDKTAETGEPIQYASARTEKKQDHNRNESEYRYENVPSSMFPNTYVRRRVKDSSNDKKTKKVITNHYEHDDSEK